MAETRSIFYMLGKRYGELKGLEHDGSKLRLFRANNHYRQLAKAEEIQLNIEKTS